MPEGKCIVLDHKDISDRIDQTGGDTMIASTTPEELYEALISVLKEEHPDDDFSSIEKAYHIARTAHKDQKRKSGEPYIVHPLCVAIILAQLGMDKDTIIGGILHDVVEDTVMDSEDVAREFGADVALLVDGVTKLTNLSWAGGDKDEIQAENLRKMFLAMGQDIRVVLIKLADRLHNMRTLTYMRPEKQKEKSRETMDIFAPIAHRLGISKIKVELDDLALQYLEPVLYRQMEEQLFLTKETRESFVEEIKKEISSRLQEQEIDAFVTGRVKHFFSIYKKMVQQNKSFDQVYDVFAVRVIVETEKDCYAALGYIHEMYKPIPGRFKDYIAMPKQNMYRSLHTTVISKGGQPFEVQIRTLEMHKEAEYGIAAHWKYKEDQSGSHLDAKTQNRMGWLRDILELHKDMADNHEFLSLLKNDLNLFFESVYCFTPNGEVRTLPNGSTIVDFAYCVHTAVGNKMVGAKVNGRLTPIDYVIKNGDQIEIMVSQNSQGPSPDWLKLAKSTQAKNKINQWFRSMNKEENMARGKKMITDCCKAKGIEEAEILKPEFMAKVVKKYGLADWNGVLASLGHGGIKESQVVNRLIEEAEKQKTKKMIAQGRISSQEDTDIKPACTRNGVLIKRDPGVITRLSKCCNPVPGDEIIGYYTKGRGVSVHRTDCSNILNLQELERQHLVEAEWLDNEGDETAGKYSVEIDIYAKNRIGLFADISRIFVKRGIDICSMNSRKNKRQTAIISMNFEVESKDELKQLVEELRKIESVIDIQRNASG